MGCFTASRTARQCPQALPDAHKTSSEAHAGCGGFARPDQVKGCLHPWGLSSGLWGKELAAPFSDRDGDTSKELARARSEAPGSLVCVQRSEGAGAGLQNLPRHTLS